MKAEPGAYNLPALIGPEEICPIVVVPEPDRRVHHVGARWRQVIEAAHDAYLGVDVDGRVVDWNHAADRLFGLTDLPSPQSVELLVAESDRPGLATSLRHVRAGSRQHSDLALNVTVHACNGESFPAECTLWGVDRRDGVLVHAFLRDVSERHDALVATSRLAAVVEGSSDAIYTRDLDGVLLTWNPAAESIFGWRADEVVGRPSAALVLGEQPEELHTMLTTVSREGAVHRVESERLTRFGHTVPLSMQSSPVRAEDGRVVAVSTIARDMTAQRQMAVTLDETLLALQDAVAEARSSEEITKRFLADAAHQLFTPVTGLRACAETLLRGVAPEDVERLLTLMIRETSRVGRLVTSLLTIARLDQGVPLEVQPVDVVGLCDEEVERAALLSPHLLVTVEVAGVGEVRLVDGPRLREGLGNLCDNARRHARRAMSLTLDLGRDEVRLVVRDDGSGVAAEQRDLIFERFVSLDGQGGSGLGLPVARAIARSMGGELSYEDGFVLTLSAPRLERPADGPEPP